MRRRVLIFWIAVINDPYERDRTGSSFRLVDGSPFPGPTVTVLFDPTSPYAFGIADFVVFCGRSRDGKETRQSRAVGQTLDELKARDPCLRIHPEPWDGDDPTDHGDIFEFLIESLPAVRRRFADRELIIHVSPGTPSRQTVLVLMGETRFIDAPFSLVKSYREEDGDGRPAVVPGRLGIDSYYKAYRAARPSETSSEEAAVVWDPGRFQSRRMRRIFDEARRFAQLNVPVLQLGERVTGKTTLVGWIRSHSPYRVPEQDARWPAVGCGQYSPETRRAALFGNKRGLFTGALKDHEVLLTIAHKDTLFLDEVGDVSRDLQRLLIKAIEEKSYMRLGDDRQLTSDFRLISATNLSNEKLRERLDPCLFDRISMLTLRLPPLREVPEEIPWLWEMVFAQALRRAGSGRIRLPDSAYRAIVNEPSHHPFPGNLRNLFRVAYRTIAAKTDRPLPLSGADACEYGPAGVEGPRIDAGTVFYMGQSVARAFAESLSLDALIPPGETVETKGVERALKGYLADELRRIAKKRGVSPETLCDVTDRTLRDWSAARERKI